MPSFAFLTPNNPDGIQRVVLRFPAGVDIQEARHYVCKNYNCQAQPISLQDAPSGQVIEVMRQSAPKTEESEGLDDEEGNLSLSGIEGSDNTPEEVTGGENDRPS